MAKTHTTLTGNIHEQKHIWTTAGVLEAESVI